MQSKMKTARETTDNPKAELNIFLKANEQGFPTEKVLVDEQKDMSAYWQTKETMLWIIIIICSMFFIIILWG